MTKQMLNGIITLENSLAVKKKKLTIYYHTTELFYYCE